ncbi:LysM peptidoglycan-binding domain-containing protein [Cohnella faecalis]|uniref:LysM peptidoglycan-binding domain-containing protein n=1 Tax=Cohnella faecalis TaxID=2315694 RepID=A0A398CMQ2_9BACL|nr:LysM peptidoglycan-binding domain-containing protein [Cohnella faecalis]RIE03883.1 LysM peptidoglycan-binding domain-containing protein [Cohnella faecalis]
MEEPYYSDYAQSVQGTTERPPYEPAPAQQDNVWGTGGQQAFTPAWPGYELEEQGAPVGRDDGGGGGEAYSSATLSSAEQQTQPDNGWLSFFQNGNPSFGHKAVQYEEEVGREPEQEAAVQASDGFLGQDELSRIVYSDGSSSANLWGDVSDRRDELDAAEESSKFPSESPSEAPKDDKADLKVAVGGRPLDAPVKPTASVTVLSLLGEKGAIREAEQKLLAAKLAEEEAALLKEAKESTGDEVEWTQLFLAKDSEHQSFRKVKLCIVQRQDTLEAIATRYNVQTRELQLHNRLTDPYISEGQVLYIP